ncbi:MAG: hypothetical protein IT539_13860 [Bradyrhizobiaceae bacterium]|nr:hypothetical protein [Bradyrhizobiaceae bacterium]
MNKPATLPLEGEPVSSLAPKCQNCGEHFTPRGSGKEQKFCKPACLRAYHDAPERRNARLGNVRGSGTLETDSGEEIFDPTPEATQQCALALAGAGATPEVVATFAGLAVQAKEEACGAPTPRPSRTQKPDFDWSEDDSVVLKEQPATAVYINPKGCIVIRQEQGPMDDEDSFVFIAPENIERLIVELQHLDGELREQR